MKIKVLRYLVLMACISGSLGTVLFGQTYTLKGSVKDTSNQLLMGATAVLLQNSDSILAYYNITNPSGQFIISRIKSDQYIFQVSYLGYAPFNLSLNFKDNVYEVDLGEIILEPEPANLKEVVVTSDRVPISINRDTIEYHADAFKTQENSAVEDLLKKLPGMEVDEDGNIKAKGKTVQKVLVDGKEFFGDDPQIATKNLPAKAVKKVQVYDKKSDMSEFTGIDDGERETTVNLTLKDSYKKGKFGNATVGYGSKDRFQLGTSVNAFSDKTKLSFIGAGNNINQQNFSMRDYFSFMGGMSGMSSGGGGRRIVFSVDGMGEIDSKRGINRVWSGGLNLSHTFGPKINLTSSIFSNFLNNFTESRLFRQNILNPVQTYFTDVSTTQKNQTDNLRWNSDLVYKIDSTQDLRWRNNLNYSKGNSQNNSLSENYYNENQIITSGDRLNSSLGSTYGYNSSLIYRKKLHPNGTALSFNASIGYNPSDSDGDLTAVNSFFEGTHSTIDSILQNYQQRNLGLLYNTRASFTVPLDKRFSLETHAELRNNDSDLNRKVYDLIYSPTFDADLNELLSRSFKQQQNYQTGGLTMGYNRKKLNISTGADLRRTALFGDLNQNSRPIEQSFLNILPFMRMSYEFTTSRSLNFEYNTRVNEPSLQELQPIIDNSDPLNVYVGNPGLKPEYLHEGNLNYNYFNQFSNINFFAFLQGSVEHNSIVNTQSVDSLFRKISRPVNTDVSYRLNGNLNFGFPLRFIHSRANFTFLTSINQNDVYVNDILNEVTSLIHGLRLNITDRNNETFEYSWGGSYNLTQVNYSFNENLNNDYYSYRLFANATLFFSKSWALNPSFSYNQYTGLSNGQNTTFPLLNIRLSKYFSNRKYELRVSVQDLLNRNTGVNQLTSLNYIDYEHTNVLGRYGLLSFIYAIRKFGRK